MRYFLLIIGLVPLITFGQASDYKIPTKVILSPGLIYQGELLGEINLMFSKLDMTTGGSAIWGPRIGLESSFTKNNYLIAPKIGYEFSGLLLCVRGNLLSYIQNKKIDVRFLPEIGLSLSGALNLCYGYNVHVIANKIDYISNHRISLTVNLDFDLWKGL